jgi:hypothetical protein
MKHRFEILCVSAAREQMSFSPVLSDCLSSTFSPPIPPLTPILDPLEYLKKVFPRAEDEGLDMLQNGDVPPECLHAQHSEVDHRQQMHDNLQQCSHANSTSASCDPYSTLPLLSPDVLHTITFDPVASDSMYGVSMSVLRKQLLISVNTIKCGPHYGIQFNTIMVPYI